MAYKIFRNDQGKVDAINRELDGVSIPQTDWNSLRLDLGDRPPTPVVLPPDFAAFGRTIRNSNFWKTKIRKTAQLAGLAELVAEMNTIAIVGPSTERMQSLAGLWNEVATSLATGVAIASGDITFLNTTATANRVPLTFAANGTATVTS